MSPKSRSSITSRIFYVIQIAELVKGARDQVGRPSAAPVAPIEGAGAARRLPRSRTRSKKKTEFDVVLADAGAKQDPE